MLSAVCSVQARWTIQQSHTAASLRGIHNAGAGIAWASGTRGTVLRTTDGGNTWQQCATPPDAEKLDFRGVQAFDGNTAFVMSSGTGDLSRVYKTTDGCKTWKLVFTDPAPDGFFDALSMSPAGGVLIGDPVGGHFAIFTSNPGGNKWKPMPANKAPAALSGESLFAASNSSIDAAGPHLRAFVTGGRSGAALIANSTRTPLPLAASDSGGAFSLARLSNGWLIAGGDYKHPDDSNGTAVLIRGRSIELAKTPPHGYRSAVAFDAASKTWIAVGPNGTDTSTDGGRNWRALDNSNWNALSLPYAVGPNGRIGKLEK